LFDTIFGLPVHPLVVHATVVVVPSAAFAVALAAASPRFRAWAGYLPLLLCAAAVVLVPVSTASGEALEHRLPQSALLSDHTRIAEGLLVPVLVLAMAAGALYWLGLTERVTRVAAQDAREEARSAQGHVSLATAPAPALVRAVAPARTVIVAIMVLAAAGVIGTTVQVARIGHSGAKAAWSGVATQQPSR
jgi:hypothetical protein